VWIAIVAILLIFLGWGMQAYSLVNWDRAVDLGLQNERFTGDAAERAWALESRGVAMADMLWALPVGIVALAGILRRKLYGFAAGLMELSVGVYFPLFFAFQRWALFRGTVLFALLVWALPSLLGILGLWVNRESFKG
jgi:hypothetical protein